MPETAAPDVLAAIVAATRRIVETRMREKPRALLGLEADRAGSRPGAFRTALTDAPAPRVIAECKRRSPSKGVLRAEYDPAAVAVAYERNGATAVSVLTEPTFFDGAPEHLGTVRAAVSIPVLRKDFIIDPYQVLEARAWGADAVLLIVAALSDEELTALLAETRFHGLDALVEVHDTRELDRAVAAGATIIGINNRDLKTLEVSTSASEVLVSRVPAGVLAVAESGLRTADDLMRLSAAGFHAFLIGERFMTATDPGAALRELRSWPRA